MRTCTECFTEKELEQYHKNRGSIGGRNTKCKACRSKAMRERYKKDAAAYNLRRRERYQNGRRSSDLKRKFGITSEEYLSMLERQSGVCAICKTSPDGINLAVDHCHSTGKIRGLLCRRCNVSLGLFNDDVTRLQNAILYLGME